MIRIELFLNNTNKQTKKSQFEGQNDDYFIRLIENSNVFSQHQQQQHQHRHG